MIVCHWQGGASGGGGRKEAVTGTRAVVAPIRVEMITSVRRKQRSREPRLTHAAANYSS